MALPIYQHCYQALQPHKHLQRVQALLILMLEALLEQLLLAERSTRLLVLVPIISH